MNTGSIQSAYNFSFVAQKQHMLELTRERKMHQSQQETKPADSYEIQRDRFEKQSKNLENSRLKELSEEEKKEVEKLEKRDQEVREHEQAHQRAGGAYVKAPQYEYKRGPNGRQYITGGSVDVDTSKGRTPEETIVKAQTIQRAALAPQNPSSQDRKVAAEAAKMESTARAELAAKRAQTLKAYSPVTQPVRAIFGNRNTSEVQPNEPSKIKKTQEAKETKIESSSSSNQQLDHPSFDFIA